MVANVPGLLAVRTEFFQRIGLLRRGEDQFESLARDYSGDSFDGLTIFVNDLQEYVTPRSTLASYARLVQALRQTGKPLFGLFGGYYTLILRKIGLGCFSNGVGYGEYRNSDYYAGGQAVRRYYMPKLHRYFTDTEAQSLLDVVDERWFRCGCNVCAGRRRLTSLASQELLDHFLNVRFDELGHAGANTLEGILDELAQTFSRLRRYRVIPPDRYNHLREWVEALRPFC